MDISAAFLKGMTYEKIAKLTAESMKKVSLELGGKNAAVVFDDANIDKAAASVARYY